VCSGRGLCDELITRPEEFYRLWGVAVCDLETSRMGAPYIYIYIYIYIYDISSRRVKCGKQYFSHQCIIIIVIICNASNIRPNQKRFYKVIPSLDIISVVTTRQRMISVSCI
jgi:hypothetical protein